MGFFTRRTETWGRDERGSDAAATSPGTGSLVLHDPGDLKIEVIKAIREVTGLGLREAKEAAESPGSVLRVAKMPVAEAASRLRAAGAVVGEVDPEPEPGLVGELERLAALHATGALSDAEFAAAKARILGQ